MKTVWEKRRVVEQNQNQDPFDEVQPKHVEALNSYDRDKKELFDYMGEIAANGFGEFDERMSAAYVHNTARSFAIAITALREELVDIEDPEQVLRQLWVADDSERVEFYRSLTQDETFQFVDGDDMDDIIQEIYAESDSYAELEEQIMKNYKEYLLLDTNNLLGRLQRIYGVDDDKDESNVDVYEQGPEVLVLMQELESIANHESQGFREGYIDGINLRKPQDNSDNGYFTEYMFSADRDHFVNKAGISESFIEYSVGLKNIHSFEGFNSLPIYIRHFLSARAEEKKLAIKIDELTDDANIFVLQLTYKVAAGDDGVCRPEVELTLRLEDIDLPLPEAPTLTHNTASSREETELSKDEKEILDSIYTEEERTALLANFDSETMRIPEDFVEDFRNRMVSMRFASVKQHMQAAHAMAEEFKQKKKH